MTMSSLMDIYRIGRGPSSSHTMAPEKGAQYMLEKYPDANKFKVILYGSLAKTGKGHGTDYVLKKTFDNIPCEIVFDTDTVDIPHPNTMDFFAYKDNNLLDKVRILSIGGGAIEIPGVENVSIKDMYMENNFDEIKKYCKDNNMSLSDYVYSHEENIKEYLALVWEQMKKTVEAGIKIDGILPGGLSVQRRAKYIYETGLRERDMTKKNNFFLAAFAYSASEENAAGCKMVTAPTCGACGVLPAGLYYEYSLFGRTDEEIIDALAVAGIIGLVIKTNASVSGAEAGCQAEIGSACSMTAAAMCALRGFNIDNIEVAAEIAMEHCLGLTCDPVGGLVQIPCIERNAVGAMRAYDAATLAEVTMINRKVTFDNVVATMYETGKDLSGCYRETAEGGLAKLYVNKP